MERNAWMNYCIIDQFHELPDRIIFEARLADPNGLV
jgi:hypothetical protein